MISDFISLIYPKLCAACNEALQKHETVLCTFCRFELPKTNFHEYPDNPVAKLFWGKVDLHAATAYYNFRKGERVQQLIHQLKYKGYQDVGIEVGKLMGQTLRQAPLFEDVDVVIPVPLHPKRQRKRGW